MDQFSSKVVLITGASSGIGAGIARSFAKCKASLSITGRDETNLKKVAEECRELGASQVLEIIGDVTKKADIENIVQRTAETFGKLNVLVNNAGIIILQGIRETNWEDFDQVINTNLKSTVFMTQMALPYLEKTKGNVVNISSLFSADVLSPACLSYSLSKAAMDQFTKTTALELSPKGIRVNSINPGGCETRALQRILGISDEARRELYVALAQYNPLEQKELAVGNLADGVLFLASDSASMITGVCLCVDGGWALTGKPFEKFS